MTATINTGVTAIRPSSSSCHQDNSAKLPIKLVIHCKYSATYLDSYNKRSTGPSWSVEPLHDHRSTPSRIISSQNVSIVVLARLVLWTMTSMTAMTFEPSCLISLFCSKLLQLIFLYRIFVFLGRLNNKNLPRFISSKVEQKGNHYHHHHHHYDLDCRYYYYLLILVSIVSSIQFCYHKPCSSLSLSFLAIVRAESVDHQNNYRYHNYDPSKASTNHFVTAAPAQSTNYIEYNLADYCTEETWSDYPGRHLIRLEKSLKIRLPSILDFQFNETHHQRMGFFRPGLYPLWTTDNNGDPYSSNAANHLHYQNRSKPTFVPYCLLSFSVDYGHRIYAEGLATGLMTGGKGWFTETLHFKTTQLEKDVQPEIGTFTISTTKNSLTLVFEQLHVSAFSFHLILTPFRDAKPEYVFGCESEHEYQCTNQRCIAKYLACDHHNNCGDYSDEAMNCMSRVPTPSSGEYFPKQQDINGYDEQDYSNSHLPSTSQVPTFPIDQDLDLPLDPNRPQSGIDQENIIPEYIDVPFPTDRIRTTISPSYIKPKPVNGFHGVDASGGGGFLGDLFRFDSKTSNVVKVVRYLLGLLVIIILVTLINFLIWCLITKRDQSFMAATADGSNPLAEQQPPQQTQTSAISIISV